MTKSTITRERLEKIKSWRETYGAGSNVMLPAEEAEELVRIALAALDSEPVAYMYRDNLHSDARFSLESKIGNWSPEDINEYEISETPLYRHAQQPVVPENCVTAEHRRVIEMLLNVCGAAFELADDSCQQDVDGEDCHVVPDDAFQKLSDALDEIENTLPTEDIDRPDVFLAWSAMPRAALKSLLQAGNSPVIPEGYVMVPKEPTDEMIAAAMNCDDVLFNSDESFCVQFGNIYEAMLAASQHDTPALNSLQSVDSIAGKWIPVSERIPEDDDFVYIWPRPDFGVDLHVGQYCERSPKGEGWYAQVYEQNYGIEWFPINVTHWMPLPAGPREEK